MTKTSQSAPNLDELQRDPIELKFFVETLIRSQLVSQLIHVLSMVPDSGAI